MSSNRNAPITPVPAKYGSIPTFESWIDQTPTLRTGVTQPPGSRRISDLPDQFKPDYSSEDRKSSSIVALASLVNTIVGGGVLSLPYAFKSLGFVTGLAVVFVSAAVTVLSLRLLCKLTVKTGSKCYADVVRKTLGANFPELTDLVMFLLLYLVLIAFMCLLSDIGGDVAEYLYYGKMADVGAGVGLNTINSGLTRGRLSTANGFSVQTRHHIASAVVLLFIYPLMTTESLHSLRHVSFIGITSILSLLVVLLKKCITVNLANPELAAQAVTKPASTQDFLTALPIVLIAFFVQFNVIDVYSNLKKPSQKNMDSVIGWTIGISAAVFAAFGLAGYFYAYGATEDNVLKNFSTRDPDLIYARVGLIITLICQTPMVGLPCRNNLILVISHIQRLVEGRRSRSKSIISIEKEMEMAAGTPRERTESSYQADINMREVKVTDSHLHRYGIPLGIVLSCLFMSQILPGVGVVWSVAGSSVSILLAFLLPSLAYIQLWKKTNRPSRRGGAGEASALKANRAGGESALPFPANSGDAAETGPGAGASARGAGGLRDVLRKGEDWEIVGAYLLLYTSCLLMVGCTYDSVRKIMYPEVQPKD